MELCDRKKKILQAIVDDYIKTAEPIGSRTIAKRNGINLSSATIRNEMADLEEMGYLEKPHTSAGRVPSVLGYRFYVNRLMQKRCLTDEEIIRLREAMEIRIREVDEIIAEISEIVSRLTEYTVIATAPRPQNPVIRGIKLLPIGDNHTLLAVITNVGTVKNACIEMTERLHDDYVYSCSAALSDVLTGKSPYDLTQEQFILIKQSFSLCPGLFKTIISYLFDWFDLNSKRGIYRGGILNMFNHPEYKDIERAKEVIRFLDDRDNIKNIMDDNTGCDTVKITIGDENEAEALRECSIVVANYNGFENMYGRIGIIGPMRMDYARIISSLEVVTENLNRLINKMYFDE